MNWKISAKKESMSNTQKYTNTHTPNHTRVPKWSFRLLAQKQRKIINRLSLRLSVKNKTNATQWSPPLRNVTISAQTNRLYRTETAAKGSPRAILGHLNPSPWHCVHTSLCWDEEHTSIPSEDQSTHEAWLRQNGGKLLHFAARSTHKRA